MRNALRRSPSTFSVRPATRPGCESIYYSEQPEQVLEFCRTLSTNVVINEGYFPGDYTIVLRKP